MADLTLDEIGNDVSTIPDLDLSFTPITGSAVVAQGIQRAWMSDRGSMFWAPDRGTNLNRLVNSDHTPTELTFWQMMLVNEAKKEDGVRSIDVELVREPGDKIVPKAKLVTKAGESVLMVGLGDAAQILTARGT